MPQPISVITLGDHIDGGYTLTAYCFCGRSVPLDLPAIATKVGREWVPTRRRLLERLRCRGCGGHPQSVILGPPARPTNIPIGD